MAVKTHALFYKRKDGEGANICVQIVHFFDGCNVLVLPLQHFTFISNQIVVTTMKRMLNKMLRYADAIVKRGVDKLIDVIARNPEPQSKSAETPQQQKRMSNDTDCAPQAIGNTTNCGLTEQTIALMDELYDIRYIDRTPEVQRHDLADKGLVSVSKPYLGLQKNPITRDASPPLVLAFLQCVSGNFPQNVLSKKSILNTQPCRSVFEFAPTDNRHEVTVIGVCALHVFSPSVPCGSPSV